MQPRLFTLVLDYLGGTYIWQFRSDVLEEGIRQWAEGVSENDLSILKLLRNDVKGLSEQPPVAVEGLKRIWCVSATSEQDELMLAHVIETSG